MTSFPELIFSVEVEVQRKYRQLEKSCIKKINATLAIVFLSIYPNNNNNKKNNKLKKKIIIISDICQMSVLQFKPSKRTPVFERR